MEYRQLGKSGLRISSVSLGTMNLHLQKDEGQRKRVLEAAIEAGINFIDTADNYANGNAETFVGQMLKNVERSRILVGTKCYFPKSDSPLERGLTRKNILHSVHSSLSRMKTDFIDILFLHRYDTTTPVEETLYALKQLMDSGEVLYWGACACSPFQLSSLHFNSLRMGIPQPVALQHAYNPFNRTIELDLSEVLAETAIGVLGYYPLAQGVLTGKYTYSISSDSRAADASSKQTMWDLRPDRLKKAEKFRELAESYGISPAVLAIKWSLRHPLLSSALTGFSNPSQLDEAVKGLDRVLPVSVWEDISLIFDNDPLNPYTGTSYPNHRH